VRAAFLSLLLAGCASAPTSTTVRVPVPVPCVAAMPQKPSFRTDLELNELSDAALIIGLALDRRDRQWYEAVLEATLAGCT
jgi:uncharacterized lipoprotein YajG